LHGPRAQLPFEQIPPQSRAGVKSSHESLEKGLVPLVFNGVITSGGPPDAGSSKSGGSGNRDEADIQVSTASPLSTLDPLSTPHHHSDSARPSSAAQGTKRQKKETTLVEMRICVHDYGVE
jgi:hypothetical protein